MSKILSTILLCATIAFSQVKPVVHCMGGDNLPLTKQKIEATLGTVLYGMNKIQKGTGDITALESFFTPDAFDTFRKYLVANSAYTARKEYQPQLIERMNGEYFDIRSIAVKVNLGETVASDMQSLVFTCNKKALITSVRAVLPQYDYQSVIAQGEDVSDSLVRGLVLDFMERFRMAYNNKNSDFLEKVFSDDALIIVGSVIKEKKEGDAMLKSSSLSNDKVRMIQVSKRAYIDGLKKKAFTKNNFINVRFEDLKIERHAKYPDFYGISCWQEWNASNYSDRGFLFIMMDYRNKQEPIIHVRTWQPKAFDDDSQYVSLYHFNIIPSNGK